MTEPSGKPKPSWQDTVMVAIFALVIALPLAAKLARVDSTLTPRENRRLARFPRFELTAKSINKFPAAFEAYYNDHFGLRRRLIRWQHGWKLRLLDVSPTPSVVLGKEGWLFDDASVEYFRAPPLDSVALNKWRVFLEERYEFVTAEGVPLVLVIAPLPSSIYPEFLPDSVRRAERPTRLDQLIEFLRTHSKVRILDLRGSLLEAKSAGRLYNRTDTHWNDHGAFIAYREIMRAVAERFPGVKPVSLSDFDLRTTTAPGGDIANLLAVPERFPEERVELVPRLPRRSILTEWLPEDFSPPAAFCMRLDDGSQPQAVVFHDSFTYASLYPFLAEHFSEIWFHWNHYFGPGLRVKLFSYKRGESVWNTGRMTEFSEKNPRVIVIVEIAERLLLYEPPPKWAEISE